MGLKKVEFSAVVFAAGKGERMKSAYPKVLTLLNGRPLIYYILKQLSNLSKNIKQIVIVVGYKNELVKKQIEELLKNKDIVFDKNKIDFVLQEKLLGTADALRCAIPKLKYEDIFVACADVPLIKKTTLLNFFSYYIKNNLMCCLLTSRTTSPNDLGRIIRDDANNICAIREKIDIDKKDNKDFVEVNSGFYIFKLELLRLNLDKIMLHPQKKEYFLTDLIEILYKDGFRVDSYIIDDYNEIVGINTQFELLAAEKILREQIINSFIEKGIRILDPQTTFIDETVKIGKNTIIYPFTFIEKNVIIGNSCIVGPFAHLRQNTRIGDNTYIGNFIEICRSKIGKNVKAKHFSYLGDAVIKNNVNIGAGTITANFDGKNKNKTIIEENSFIGSDTILVAPVKVGKSSITGAGSVITKNVKPKTVVVGVPARFLKKL